MPIRKLVEDLRYYLKKPGPKRKSYVLVCYRPISRTKKEYLPLADKIQADADSINEQLQNKIIKHHEAELLFSDLIQTQYRKSKVQGVALKRALISEVNAKVLNRFWTAKYEVRYLEDESSARYDFERAFRAIEPLSLQSASQGELQKALKKNLLGVSQIRRATDRLNEVLKFLKRELKLEKPKKERKAIRHLTKAEVLKLVPAIECIHCRDLAMSLFVSGARLGEAMALEPSDLRGLELSITKQRTAYGLKKIKAPKREKTGTVAIFELGSGELKRWLGVEEKWSHRWHLSAEISKACAKAKLKRISPHDLRHSHAIHLLTLGATLTDVSLNLRNRIEVCQEYYTGYAHSEGTLERLKRLAKA
jgi:integrase